MGLTVSKISWCTHVANWQAGCTKVSQGCKHCWAESMTRMRAKNPRAPGRYRGEGISLQIPGNAVDVVGPSGWTGTVVYDRAALKDAFDQLARLRKPAVVFVNALSDTFHTFAPVEALRDLTQEILLFDDRYPAGKHTIILLTKRPMALLQWQLREFPEGLPAWVWVGVSVENQDTANERIPPLMQVQTRGVRVISAEPLLGPIDLRLVPGLNRPDVPTDSLWMIVGGESGAGARPMDRSWARTLRDQCWAAEVPFYFKQWGAGGDDHTGLLKGLPPHLDGIAHTQCPQRGLHGAYVLQAYVRQSLRRMGSPPRAAVAPSWLSLDARRWVDDPLHASVFTGNEHEPETFMRPRRLTLWEHIAALSRADRLRLVEALKEHLADLAETAVSPWSS